MGGYMTYCIVLFLYVSSLFVCVQSEEDLYKVLGVKKSASRKDIKQAYKQLAKEWHPDKNSSPGANDKFIKINEAYETLGDDEKRRNYDKFGTTSATEGQRQGGGGHGHFDSFFSGFGGGGGFKFNFGGGGGNEDLIDKYRINMRMFTETVIPNCHEKPYLLYAYAEFCFNCMQVEAIFDKVVSDMENIGMGIGTVHVQLNRQLTSKLGLSSVPAIMGVIEGKVRHYSGPLSIHHLRQYVRTLVPSSYVTELDDSNYEAFLSSWQDNRVRMVFSDRKDEPSLRFLMPAFAYRKRVAAGFINTANPKSAELRKKFGIQSWGETLLMFNENTDKPCAHVSMETLPRSTMDEVIETNMYLILPRLSSQEIFNTLCPAYTNVKKKSLCVVLLTQAIEGHTAYREAFRKHALRHPSNRVRYTYIYENTQQDFVKSITKGEGPVNGTSGSLKVAVVWRKEPETLQLDWLEEGWFSDGPQLLHSQHRLVEKVDWLLSTKQSLPVHMKNIPSLIDEHGKSLFFRILQRLSDWYDVGMEKLYSMDELAIITTVTSLVCLLAMFILMKTVFTLDQPPTRTATRPAKADPWRQTAGPYMTYQRPVVNMFPVNGTNFEEMVVRTKPGVRTIMIMVNQDVKNKLIREFAQIMEHFSRSNAFQFAYLQLEDDLPWYKCLLEKAVGEVRDLSHLNPTNCLGTILAINGPRKYYSIYHAHAERTQNRSSKKHKNTSAGDNKGAFMGFGESDSDSEVELEAEILFEADLLNRLGSWMEKLCEGSIPRIRVDAWPTMS